MATAGVSPSLFPEARRLLDRLLAPLTPIATGVEARLAAYPVRALLLDVYGTILISAAGDVGVDAARNDEAHALAALDDAGLTAGLDRPPESLGLAGELARTVAETRARAKQAGVQVPEVDILAVWTEVLARVAPELRPDPESLRLLALSYECRVNPVWPMPGLDRLLDRCLDHGVLLGILSNAQFYTPLLLEYFLGDRYFAAFGDPRLLGWSYLAGCAKPDPAFAARLAAPLAERGVRMEEVLLLGNDMRKDVAAASRQGWRTALFAGDLRSLRWRRGEAGLAGVRPDMVVDSLDRLAAHLCPGRS